ncbi:MAG: endopeptidase La [SAR324 cluster bacterium]|jgi:ATP-dependent Lon protease|nr:endopeptidase La [SAR324 cluster bacterium]MDP7138823.1 endopeptidase La [SAR324 cluster bacterium]MDP7501803.1 endopeptidase La [SAR324 cluster bacterium]|tara:strand:+ start:6111 stop:8528 length:2418 start_codon:yes stop_codon:yes gene_type:complete
MRLSAKNLTVPLLPMREEIIYPGSTTPFFVGRKSSMEALDKALSGDRQIIVVAQRVSSVEEPKDEDLFEVGVLGRILQVMRLPNGTVKALFEGQHRARILESMLSEKDYSARIEVMEPKETEKDREKLADLSTKARALAREHFKKKKSKTREEVLKNIEETEPQSLADRLSSMMEIDRDLKQNLLEEIRPVLRLETLIEIMEEEKKISKLENQLKKQVKEQMSSSQKDDYLQDQLKSIQKELGQMDDPKGEVDELARKVKEAKMPSEVQESTEKEVKKLKMMSPLSAEANVIRNYLEWLVAMPWENSTEDNFDLKRAQKILDEDHYGLEKVKERIVEYLAVASLKKSLKGPILCLTGPPGVGKTSLAQSIAGALDRKFVRISLGGVRDEAEIRGHRRTYIGALPGKIIQSIRKAKSRNPVLLIDEIDKLYQSALSDPSAAMLEVLDPEQNNTFMDHYLEVEWDLSSVLFICTANTTQSISSPLLDRMEQIPLSGYTELEKQEIARRFLVPRQAKSHGLKENWIRFKEEALKEVIMGYTREAGVRNLEREIGKVCRKVVTKLVRTGKDRRITVTPKMVKDLLGVPAHQRDYKADHNEVGIAMGLGVTQMGGELMLIEAGLMPGSGKTVLTGKLGEVMQESAKAAYSFVRSKNQLLGINEELFAKSDLHIHIPDGAIPKDGPSAGLPLMISIISAFTKNPVKNEVAMTGEITLRGQVTEIGGLKEKLLAARRGNLTQVIIPEDNEKDLEEIPKEILEDLKIISVLRIDDALEHALESSPLIPQTLPEQPLVINENMTSDSNPQTPVA